MKWQRGIVMERIGRHAVIMTPTGEFKRVKVTGNFPDIGEEIRVPVQRNLFNLPPSSWIAVAAAVIIMLVASPLLTFINQPPEMAVAYVAIDINPSVELTVSNYDNVLNVHAYNSDGQKVLAGLDLKGSNYKEAVAQIGKKAIELGYVAKESDNTFVISVSPLANTKVNKIAMENALMASVNHVLMDSRVEGDIRTIHVPVAIRETATKRGISPAKYAVLLEAVDAGLPVTEKDMQEKSIKVAIASAGGVPDQIIDQAEDENKFEDKEQKYFALLSKTNRDDPDNSGNNQTPGASVASASKNEDADSDAKPEDKKPVIDPVRRPGDPEVTDRPSGTNSGSNQVPTTGAIPANTGDGANSDSGSNSGNNNNTGGVSIPSVDPAEDQKTDDNYMGITDKKPVDNTNQDMNILKPNF